MKNISDQQLRAYFLGRLSAAEAEILELECAAGAELTEQAQTVERELADDYLRGSLSANDARLFESNYLTTDARRIKLRVVAGLWQIVREEKSKSAVAAAANSVWQTLFDRKNALKFVFGTFILLFVCGAVAFYLSNPSVDDRQVAGINVPDPAAAPENPAIQNPATETQNPVTAPTEISALSNLEANKNINSPQKNQAVRKNAPASKRSGQSQPALAVFALLPGTLRDAGEQFITVAPAMKNLGLRLKLPEDAGKYRIYRAVVKTAEGDSIFTAPNLKSSNFRIPVEKLENRTYIVFLEGKNDGNKFESVADYSFRVRR